MKPSFSIATGLPEAPSRPRQWLARLAKTQLLKSLARLKSGQLTLIDDGERHAFGSASPQAPEISLHVLDDSFYADAVFGGSIGVAESYMLGHWKTRNLTDLVRLMVLNREVIDGIDDRGLARLAMPLRKLLHWLNRNTQPGSRRNIAAHYDLGNELFACFLDETWMYSSAIFERPDMTLAEASTAKLDRICRKLALKPGDSVLEIGTGWGGFALHAARHYGCHVTTTTISSQQHELASRRIAEAGLQDRITLLMKDYRDLDGQYDKLVSIEMIEAVGHKYYDTYFAQCNRLLKPHGQFLLQGITITDQRFEAAAKSVDFIQRYIFPGSTIPSVTALLTSATRASDLRLYHLEDIGPHYATTLAHWRQNFFRNIDRVRALGYSEAFIRMWDFYLCYCEGGFAERALGDVQMHLVKPGARP
ncbi:MAG: class I SAM-dependent methyltransferase [Hydrogenophilaceae bacterium]|nr:class I SAM-dependent methyltransferase [Hydrogenophilaceae bacterium]